MKPNTRHLIFTGLGILVIAGTALAVSTLNSQQTQVASLAAQLIATVDGAGIYTAPAVSDPATNLHALQTALSNSSYNTIDGGGRTYTINGRLTISRSVTLQNINLIETNPAYDSKAISVYSTTTYPVVTLQNIVITMNVPSGGGSVDANAIYINHAQPTLKNIEVKGGVAGGGKGNIIQISYSNNAVLQNINVHDFTWEPFSVDKSNPSFYNNFNTAYMLSAHSYTPWQIHDYVGSTLTANQPLHEQINGIVIQETDVAMDNVTVSKLQAKFSNGEVEPYQTDGIDLVEHEGKPATINNANVSYVHEGIDSNGYPASYSHVTISNSHVHDVLLACYKLRSNYQVPQAYTDTTQVPVIINSTAINCGETGFKTQWPADAWFINTTAANIGEGPGTNTLASKLFSSIAAYKEENSDPIAATGRPIGMRIVGSTITNLVNGAVGFAVSDSPYYSLVRNTYSDTTASLVKPSLSFTNIPDNTSKSSTAKASWNDITAMATALSCTLTMADHEKLFIDTSMMGQNYGQIQTAVQTICGSGGGSGNLPDLTVARPATATATVGTPIVLTADVTNQGNASTGTSFIDTFWIDTDKDSTNGYTSYKQYTSPAFAAGHSDTAANASYTFNTAGTYYYRVCVDHDSSGVGKITESNESNNCSGWVRITVTGQQVQPKPDLTTGIVTPTTAKEGTATTFTASIHNAGSVSTGAGFTTLLQKATSVTGTGATDVSTKTIAALGANAYAPASFSYTPAAAGTIYMRICADKQSSTGTGVITETSETNNCSAWTAITVASSGGTGGGGSCTGAASVALTANGSSGTITLNPGDSITLAWTITNEPSTASCTLSGSDGTNLQITPNSCSVTGNTSRPMGSTRKTYTLTCPGIQDSVAIQPPSGGFQ